ncbi:glycosyltransferase family protein [Halegenticoccus soli]|uniref:hypothetical protein n=1 Tax=Halegenticoccus soli TaxID=1985678 RepID=UPI000C6E0E18|nr:hypothetical protein [Halegenticoccus soli]
MTGSPGERRTSDRRTWRAARTVRTARTAAADHAWFGVALCAAVAVYVAYLSAHTHPAYEGGLYLRMAAEIRAHGYAPPERIPHYTARGVPFAYPPLAFYAAALLVDLTGVDPVSLALYLPGIATIACLAPYYLLAREFLGPTRRAGVATVLFAVTPPVLRWHISAGGLVRAPAFLLTLTGLYVGVRLFRTGGEAERRRRHLVPAAAVLFGLTVLTHPVYATFFATSYLLFFAAFDRTARGLLRGAAVAAGGLALSSPWLVHVVSTHGADVFLAASGTHTGLGGGLHRLGSRFVYPLSVMDALTPFYALAFAGALYALYRRRFFLPLWLLVAGYFVGKQRFVFVPGAMLSAALLFDLLAPRVAGYVRSARRRRTVETVVAATLLVCAGALGVAFAASALQTAHEGGHTQPQTVDSADLEAMAWARAHTSPSADFVVLGDGAEWFPLYAERTILASPWGAEWTTTGEYHRQEALFKAVSSCREQTCLRRSLAAVDGDPEYVYVPTDAYTVQGEERGPPTELIASLRGSDRYELRFENEGAVIFRIADGDAVGSGSDSTRRPTATASEEGAEAAA